jgi:prepilin peptidase CpaA
MDKYLLICALIVAIVGAVKDLRGRRIPNLLTYSGLLSGLAVRLAVSGWPALKGGAVGVLLAGGIFFVLFALGSVGGGDVKLMAAVGAWAGVAQVVTILLAASIFGGVMAAICVLSRKQVRQTILNTVELIRHHLTSGLQPHPALNVRQAGSLRIPYGLAIAMGTLYCVANVFWWR